MAARAWCSDDPVADGAHAARGGVKQRGRGMTRSKVATLFVVVMVLVFPALGAAAGQTTVTSVYTVDGQAVWA